VIPCGLLGSIMEMPLQGWSHSKRIGLSHGSEISFSNLFADRYGAGEVIVARIVG
jgi:hypothetical protein